ncbi:MAG TPA: hypothetical protein VI754_04755 [Bacteriovoracaceae bacterium]|nr:hypothetical protein [Bacteriovoracaceae bacterium]
MGLLAGGFTINAVVRSQASSISNFGIYRFNYFQEVIPQIDLMAGYTLIMEDSVSGDLGFGIDIGPYFYPYGSRTSQHININNISLQTVREWNPFLAIHFHQRQFQSISSNYAGFGASGGIERAWKKNLLVIGELTYINLSGPSDSSAVELDMTLGVVYVF